MAVQSAAWIGQPRIKGSSEPMQMCLLTLSMIGLQFCWSTEMTYASPYLLSLGLSKSKLSLVWVAGPLSGLIMQPVIGMISDKSTSKYGRRRPFMVVGAVLASTCLLLLGWTSEVVGVFVKDTELRRRIAVAVAVVDIYVLDFVINIAQTTCRALVVDALPVDKQQIGSAWVSRMSGVGSLLIYGIGALDLNRFLGGFLGATQFKKMCLIAAISMSVAQGITCWAVTERVLVSDGKARDRNPGIIAIMSQIYSKLLHLPERIQAICWIQFWSWIGWFPFLFYGSTWVGEIYIRHEAPDTSRDALTDVGRAGSISFTIFSIISFGSSVVLPWLVQSPDEDGKASYTRGGKKAANLKNKPTLLTIWALANLVFACSMILAPLVRSVAFATVIIAFCGIPWAVAGWAPGSFLGVEVNKMSSTLPIADTRGAAYHRLSDEAIELESTTGSVAPSSSGILHLRHDSDASVVADTSTGELSGIYLGILNIYTTLPQFVGTGISWVVFSIFEPGKSPELATDADPSEHHSTEGVSGIAVCLFIGALSACGAAWATRRLKAAS